MKKNLFTYILPAALVAGFLCFFFYDAFHYQTNIDDSYNDAALSRVGIIGSVKLFFMEVNGRWFSHIITAIGFKFLKHNYVYYALYVSGIMLLFVASIAVLYRRYYNTFFKEEVTAYGSILFAFVFTATLYFLLFAGRQEIWAWVSSANNHLLSVILSALLFALLLKENRLVYKTLAVFLLAAAIGGLNEVNAVCCAMAVFGFFVVVRNYYREVKISSVDVAVAICIIIASLSVNVLSGGYASRMNGLPDFTLGQSLKNTVHTFALPVMQYQLIGLRLFALFAFLFFLDSDLLKLKVVKQQLVIGLGILAIVWVSFFLHCFILSDIVPARGEVWGYTLVLFVLAVKNRNEPIQLPGK
jgi:hypothetical protein